MPKKRTIKEEEAPVVKLIRKSNDLVEARYKFDIWETRVFTKMLTMIRQDDEDFKEYRIYLKDLIKEYGLQKDKAAYRWLKSGAIKLGDKTVRILRDTEEGLKEFRTKIVAGTESFVNDEEGKYIDVSFHPRMKPYLLALKSRFTVYDARNILKLPSTYSIRIYELLKQYEKIGWRKFDLEELKEIVGALEIVEIKGQRVVKDSYPLYGNFRQKVLLKAQRGLKKFTDICFDFEQVRRGKAVKELIFYIKSNIPEHGKNGSKPPMALPEEISFDIDETPFEEVPDTANVDQIYEQVKEWVAREVVEQWIESLPLEQIQRGVNYTLRQIRQGTTISNIGGYLQRMVRMETLVDPVQEKQKKHQQRKEVEQKEQQLKNSLEKELSQIIQYVTAEEKEIVRTLFAEDTALRQQVADIVKSKPVSSYDSTLSIDENLKSPMVVASFMNTVQSMFPERFAGLEPYRAKIKALKKQIIRL